MSARHGLVDGIHFFEGVVDGRLYRVVAQSGWDPRQQRPLSRQVLLGPADPPPVADLAKTRTVGTRRVGDTGALGWVAEQLDFGWLIDEACGAVGPAKGPAVGELAPGVALQRACAPGAERDLAAFLDSSVARISCPPIESFTGQAFHRGAAGLTPEQRERAQLAIARAASRPASSRAQPWRPG